MKLTNVRKAEARAKAMRAADNLGKMVTGAIALLIITFMAWSLANADVLWKTMRYPEAVRQMEIEILIKSPLD